MTLEKISLLTMRQFLFLHWLFQRKTNHTNCNLANTKILCQKCLNNNAECKKGVIPASYFYQKISRQYYDCKRVLDTLVNLGLIIRREIPKAIDYHLFYEITSEGIDFYHKFREYYAIDE
ncbi:MAG: hypothetical protein ACTSWL_03905 [Promethearchaeota archaeon]